MSFPHYKQLDAMDCGPTSLRIVAQHYGRHYSLQSLRERCHITREGVSLLGISDAAEAIGLRTTGVKIAWEQLRDDAGRSGSPARRRSSSTAGGCPICTMRRI